MMKQTNDNNQEANVEEHNWKSSHKKLFIESLNLIPQVFKKREDRLSENKEDKLVESFITLDVIKTNKRMMPSPDALMKMRCENFMKNVRDKISTTNQREITLNSKERFLIKYVEKIFVETGYTITRPTYMSSGSGEYYVSIKLY